MTRHKQLTLYISDHAYVLVPEGNQPSLIINRTQNGALTIGEPGTPSTFDRQVPNVAGIFGIIALARAEYLVLIKSTRGVATFLDCDIFTPTSFAIYPIPLTSSAKLLAHWSETYLLSVLKSHLSTADGQMFYTYSETWDLTSSLQRQPIGLPSHQRHDDRFFWNKHLHLRLLHLATVDKSRSEEYSKFILPMIYGFVAMKTASINGQTFQFGLVSRRSRHRAGTRYFSRGIDALGHVSNFNETEMLLVAENGNTRASYIQTRGSVPVYWAEINNLRYKPDLQIMDVSATNESLRRHFTEQLDIYGDQYLVNLVNQKGYEKAVKDAYEKAIGSLGNDRVHYIYFDFHHECKGLRFDRVQGLIDRLQSVLEDQGYFYQEGSRPVKRQASVIRTNCMDCLDRTNVVQSALAKDMLADQLRRAGILSLKESIDNHPDFLFVFRNVWADNADAISKAYSGTGALKTDYTRFGVRSKKGALQDGINSVVRYVKNNFLDGPRQDAYDLISGTWQPSARATADWGDAELTLFMTLVPIALGVALALVLAGLGFPQLLETRFLSPSQILLGAMSVMVASGVYIAGNGVAYVSKPRLVGISDQLNYSGPGHISGRNGRGFMAQTSGSFKKRLD